MAFSGRDGSQVWSKSTPAGGQRSVVEFDLGGKIGRVIIGAKEEEGAAGSLKVFALHIATGIQDLWEWHGPEQNWGTPSGPSLAATADQTGDGVLELAIGSRDGKLYILNGATGELHKEIRLFEGAGQITIAALESKNPQRLLFVQSSDPDALLAASGPQSHQAGCVQLSDGAVAWRKSLGPADGFATRDLDGDGAAELYWWKAANWSVLNGHTGETKGGGARDSFAQLYGGPLATDLENDGTIEFVLISADAAQPVAAVRSLDGKLLWEGPTHTHRGQPTARSGLLLRSADGEVLLSLEDALVALDPRTGQETWRTDGRPEGALTADADADGQDEVYVGLQRVGLVCVDRGGHARWTLRLDGDISPRLLLPDTDGDGLADLLIHRHGALLGVVRGPRLLWSAKASGPLQATPLVVDADGDGRPEVIQLGPWGQDRQLLCLDAATGAERWAVKHWIAPNRAPAVADWDGDGKPDVIAVGHALTSSVMELLVFRAADGALIESIPVEPCGWLSSTPAVADFNGDGAADAAVHRWDARDVIAIDGRSKRILWKQGTAAQNFGGVAAADLDGDGLPDVVAPSLDGQVYALRGAGGGLLWKSAAGPSRSAPTLADISGDGVPDVLLVTGRGELRLLDGKTGQPLGSPEVEGASEGLGRPAVATAGGRKLIVAPLGAAGAVAFDAGTFQKVWQSAALGPVLASPVVSDLDRDGLTEVVVATAAGNVAVLDLETGSTLWRCRMGDELIEADPAVVEVNGDGVLDILIAGHDFQLTAVGCSRLRAKEP